MVVLRLKRMGRRLSRVRTTFLFYGVSLNVVLTLLNILPIPPLDGSHILAGFSYRASELFNRPQAQMFGMLVFVAIFFATPIGAYLFGYADLSAIAIIDFLGTPLGNTDITWAMYGERIMEQMDQMYLDQMLEDLPQD